MTAALRLRGVGKEYRRGASPVRVLRDIDLQVDDGEYVAIVGRSGSGKSTLLNLIGTLDRPTEGSVAIAGHDVTDLTDSSLSRLRSCELGFVFQQFFLMDGRSALENVADGLLYQGVARRARLKRAAEALERVGLGHRLDHAPEELSGGECQRVAIARALVHEPRILLADEPTGNLDSEAGATVLELFDELHRDGSTIVMITHDSQVASGIPRTVRLRDGRIESDVMSRAAS